MDSTYILRVVPGFKETELTGSGEFVLQLGENFLGREVTQSIVLKSPSVSKKHAVLTWKKDTNGKDEFYLKDLKSRNGTFLNGHLIQNKKIVLGDRIGLGDFFLDFLEISSVVDNQILSIDQVVQEVQVPPEGVLNKLHWELEHKIFPPLFDFFSNYEWRWIGAGLFLCFSILSLVISMPVVLESHSQVLLQELARRAQVIAREVAEKNTPLLASQKTSSLEITDHLRNAPGVQLIFVVDLQNRILAPSDQMNQYLAGLEAQFSLEAREKFLSGQETGYWKLLKDQWLMAVEPILVLNSRLGKNQPTALVIVSLDAQLSHFGWGQVGVFYAQAFIVMVLLGLLFGGLWYRLTLRPFKILQKELDFAIRGKGQEISKNFKMQETEELWKVIEVLLHRFLESQQSAQGNSLFNQQTDFQEIAWPLLKNLGSSLKTGFVLMDSEGHLVFLNSFFEELSGIRLEGALGSKMTEVARDQALGAFVADLIERTKLAEGGSLNEEYDFSGVSYQVFSWVVDPSQPKGFILLIEKKSE